MLRDRPIAQCVEESGKTAPRYLSRALDLRTVTLRSGESMTVAIGADACLALNQSVRVYVYERVPSGYRRVLDSMSLAGFVDVSPDGTATLPTHESIDVMMESTYLWNGRRYVFSADRSHLYNLDLQQRRPYQREIRFAPGGSDATLTGTVAFNFGDHYGFTAHAGQTVTIKLTQSTRPPPSITLYHGDDLEPVIDSSTGRWSSKLRASGEYFLLIFGTDERNPERLEPYKMVLRIFRSVR